jgi:hypothetical protein
MGTTETWFGSRTRGPQRKPPIGRQLKDTRAFSGTSLFFGVLASAGCAAIIPALGAGRLATVAGAALSPLLVALLTTRGRGLIRSTGIAAVSALALIVTIGGFTVPEAIAGRGSLTGTGAGTFVTTKRVPAPAPPAPWPRTSAAVTPAKPPTPPRTSAPPTPPAGMDIVIPEIRKCPEVQVGGAKACKQISIRNVGSTTVEVATGDVEGDHAGDFTLTRVCDGKLKPDTACSIRLRFWPTATGAREAFLVVHLQPGDVRRRVTLTGDAIDGGTEPTGPTETPSPSPSPSPRPSEPRPTVGTQNE